MPSSVYLIPIRSSLRVEGFALDAEDLSGAARVAAGCRKHLANLFRFGVGQRVAADVRR